MIEQLQKLQELEEEFEKKLSEVIDEAAALGLTLTRCEVLDIINKRLEDETDQATDQ